MNIETRKEDVFSKLSLGFAFYAVLMYAYFFFYLLPDADPFNSESEITTWPLTTIIVACFLGIMTTVLSLIRKEKSKYLMLALLFFNFFLLWKVRFQLVYYLSYYLALL